MEQGININRLIKTKLSSRKIPALKQYGENEKTTIGLCIRIKSKMIHAGLSFVYETIEIFI
jgi:hypothetical protein